MNHDNSPRMLQRKTVIDGEVQTVSVNPNELSFHNIDNILALDRHISKRKIKITERHSDCRYQMFDVYGIYGLLHLDSMDLYEPKFDGSYRGGSRFLFFSRRLSHCLFWALKSRFPDMVKVNPVFRYNKFEPDDAEFKPHYDTPYMDSRKRLYSKYTVLIYLSGGSNPDGALEIADTVITDIPEASCIIFDQEYEHSGRPYTTGMDKLFIRTELIYRMPDDLDFSYEAAKAFNIGCVATKYNDHKYASQLFNHVCKLRYGLTFGHQHYKLYIVNKFMITNNNDYWTLDTVPIKTAVMYILMHYFKKVDDVRELPKKCNIPEYLRANAVDPEMPKFSRPEHKSRVCRWCDTIHSEFRIHNYCSVSLFDGQIHINPDDIDIGDTMINFKCSGYFKGVNFASCNYEPSTSKYTFNSPVLPPIFYRKDDDGLFHYNIDLFNNGLVIKRVNKRYA